MHIPGNMLAGHVVPVTNGLGAVAGGLLGAGARAWIKREDMKETEAGENNVLKTAREFAVYGAGAWVSVLAAAALCSAMLAFSGVVDFGKVFSAMMGAHLLIGAGEAVISVAVIALFAGTVANKAGDRLMTGVSLGAAAFIGLFMSPFASSFPDGLEFVAGNLGFEPLEAANFVTPFADYTFPQIVPAGEMFSTGLAGLTGVLITFAVVWLCGMVLKSRAVIVQKQ